MHFYIKVLDIPVALLRQLALDVLLKSSAVHSRRSPGTDSLRVLVTSGQVLRLEGAGEQRQRQSLRLREKRSRTSCMCRRFFAVPVLRISAKSSL